jgi:LSD1 subclass zinc finger protein
MKVDCPHCRATLNLPAEFGGTTVRCPKCMETFRAETGETAVQTKPLPVEPIPASLRESHPEPADHDGGDTASTVMWVVGGAVVVIILLVVLVGALFVVRSGPVLTTIDEPPAVEMPVPHETPAIESKEAPKDPDPKK